MNPPNEDDQQGDGSTTAPGRIPLRLADLQKNITMAQIAKAAGVSQGAISSLLNDRDYGIRVSEKTRERVFKVCREMGYLPNDLRAVVRMYPELGDFAMLISSRFADGLAHPTVGRLAAAALKAVPPTAGSLTFAFYDEDTDYLLTPDLLPHPAGTGTVSKFIFVGPANPSLIQSVTRHGHAVVSLGQDIPLPGVQSIVPDLAGAAALAIQHLAKLGHRRLAIVSGPFGSTEAQIIDLNHGVRMACEKAGVTLEAENIVHGDLSSGAGMAAFDALAERKLEPTAIFCLSDSAAAGVLARALARGLQIPAQLSVVGCGDDPSAALLSPPLTTVRLPLEEVAALGVREIDRMVGAGEIAEPHKTVLPASLVVRGTSAPLEGEPPRASAKSPRAKSTSR
jgi:DNA-binding LacI/PurR family transcriptional regulator